MIETLKSAIYVLCLAASASCAYLLLRAYFRNRTRLLFWSGLCFVFLAINSLVVIADILIFPELDLQPYRHAASLLAVGTLLFGLIWEMD
jgi:hypothetical protein